MTLLKPQPKSITSALQHLTLHTYFFDVRGLVKAQLTSELRVSSSSTLTQELHTQVTHLQAWELLSWNLSWQAKPLSFTQTPQVCHRNQSTVSKEAPLTFRSRPRDAAERRNKTKKNHSSTLSPGRKKNYQKKASRLQLKVLKTIPRLQNGHSNSENWDMALGCSPLQLLKPPCSSGGASVHSARFRPKNNPASLPEAASS